jgi:hypothetical protein
MRSSYNIHLRVSLDKVRLGLTKYGNSKKKLNLKLSYNVLTDVSDTLEGGLLAHFGACRVCDVAHQDLETERLTGLSLE